VRVAAWVFVACTLASVIGVFLPSFELEVHGVGFGRRTSLSLYQTSANREFLHKLVAGYHRGAKNRVGGAVLAALSPKRLGKVSSLASDARDAADTIDSISDDDARTIGRVLAATVWGFLLLHLVMGGLVFGDTIQDVYRRRRAIAALVLSLVVAALALAIHLAARRAVWEANDDLGKDLVELGAGAYLTPIAAVVGLAAIGFVVVQRHRHARAAAAPAPAS
jgi:hypothetical protein